MHVCGVSIVRHSAYGSTVICWNHGQERGSIRQVDTRQALVVNKADTACIDELRRSAGLSIGHIDPVRRFASFESLGPLCGMLVSIVLALA